MMDNRDLVKSKDFLTGYIYKMMERQVALALCKDKPEQFPVKDEISIPWSWCTPRQRVTDFFYDNAMWASDAELVLMDVAAMVRQELQKTFPKARLKSSACVVRAQKGWRSEVCFEIHQEPEIKEMTVEEIEAALGYKVKIVGDK